MKPMSAARTSLRTPPARERRTSTGVFGWVVACLVGLSTLLGAGAASADTASPLPKGYTSDERGAAQPVTDKDEGWVVGDKAPAQDGASAPRPTEPSADEFADTDPRALDDFEQPLAPFGQWVEDPTYGTVWVPDDAVVGNDFAPYQTAGHWSLTEDEQWYWASDYDWGYIPFHYGRWVWIGGRGWSWIPGRTYAPAWVTWRVGEYGYIGWAPLPPSWYWWGGVAVSLYAIPPAAYCFVPTAYVFHHHMTTYIVRDRTAVQNAASHTRPYTAASPTSHQGAQPHPGGKTPASPGSPQGHGARTAASPTVGDAHVPSNAVPQSRVRPDKRAVSLARPSAAPSYLAAPSRRGLAGSSAPQLGRSLPASRGWDARPGAASSSRRGFDSPSGPASRPSPFTSDPGSRSYAPHASSPSFRPSTPSYRPSAPSSPSFHPSAPSTPSYRPSAPSYHPSAPAARPSGGGFRGGGGHRR